MDNSSERMRILEMIENGQISAEEGLRQLAELPAVPAPEAGEPGDPVAASEPGRAEFASNGVGASSFASRADGEALRPDAISQPLREDFERWKGYWMIPFWVGIAITIAGGLLMNSALQRSGVGFWFLCATLPFILGVLVMLAGAYSRTARWLHVRVQQPPGERPQRIAISFPIPIGLTVWFLRTFRSRLPGMENVPQNVDQLLIAMRDSASADEPIYIRVDDEDDGEKVEVYIG